MLVFNKNILTIGGNRLEGESLTPPEPPTPPAPSFDEVTIGTQTWKNVNLAVDDGQGGIVYMTVNYGQGNVTEYFYTWDAAVRVAATVQGWHLPTKDEWDTLISTIGGTNSGAKLKSTYGWYDNNGTDDYGFSAFPSGNWNFNTSENPNVTMTGIYWSATERSSSAVQTTRMTWQDQTINSSWYGMKSVGYPVRLIKDT